MGPELLNLYNDINRRILRRQAESWDMVEKLYRLRGDSIKQLMPSSIEVVLNSVAALQIGLHAQLAKRVRHSALFNAIVKMFDARDSDGYAGAGNGPDRSHPQGVSGMAQLVQALERCKRLDEDRSV